jgi:hypothetical protein
MKRILFYAVFAALIAAGTLTGHAQELTGPPADPQYKYSTPMPPGIAMPDKIETRLGTLNFFDGFPAADQDNRFTVPVGLGMGKLVRIGRLPVKFTAEVALQHRAQIHQVITGAPFNQAQAQQVSQEISGIAAQRMVNRLELRNQILQVLTPQQRQQYIQMVQQSLEGLE